MKKIYETRRYAGKLNIDYEKLDALAEELREGDEEYERPIVSYARVSTPRQANKLSLGEQHEANVREIRKSFDNPIVYITEVGSGGEAWRKRLLFEVIEYQADLSDTFIYCRHIDRLTRNIEAFVDTAKTAEKRHLIFMVGEPFNEKYQFITYVEMNEIAAYASEFSEKLKSGEISRDDLIIIAKTNVK